MIAVPPHALLGSGVAIDKCSIGHPWLGWLMFQFHAPRIPSFDAALDLLVDCLLDDGLHLGERRRELAYILSIEPSALRLYEAHTRSFICFAA